MEVFDSLVPDLLHMLESHYYKILKVDLTHKVCTSILISDGVLSQNENIESGVEKFIEENNVYHYDVDAFKEFMSVENIKGCLSKKEKCSLRYRRKVKDSYRWSIAEVSKALDCTDDNYTVMLYVRDIEDEFNDFASYQTYLEDISNSDELTGLLNRRALHHVLEGIDSSKGVGVLYADLNKLKWTNDTKGHLEGDRLITDFTKLMLSYFRKENCFRVGGDEFVVLLQGIEQEHFINRIVEFIKKVNLSNGECPVASVGVSWGNSDVSDVMVDAEKSMYSVKEFLRLKYNLKR